MKKLILLIIIFLSQGIMSWGQSDTLSYESIMSYYKSKTNLIEFYQMSENTDKVSSLTKERDSYIDALGDSYGKGLFFLILSKEYYDSGDYLNAIKECSKTVEIYKKILGINHPEYVWSLESLANYYSETGNYLKSIRFSSEARERGKIVFGNNHPYYAAFLNNLADDYSHLGNYFEAIRLGTEAQEIYKQIYGNKHENYATALCNLASYYSLLGNNSEAMSLDKEALEIRKNVLGKEHPEYVSSLSNLADDYYRIGNYSEAIHLCIEALEIRKSIFGTSHPKYAESLHNLSSYYSAIGQYTEAIRLGAEAMNIQKQYYGIEHPNYALSLSNLAIYKFFLGKYTEAIGLGTEAMKIRERIFGTNHPLYAQSLHNLSLYYSKINNFDEAIRLCMEAIEIQNKVLGYEFPNYALTLINVALYHLGLKKYTEAIRFGTEAMEISKNVFGIEHPNYASSLNNLALCNYEMGNYSNTYELLKEYTDITPEYIFASFPNLPFQLQKSLWENKYATKYTSLFPSAVYKHQISESVSDLYNKTALFSKGILLNTSISMRKLILESGDSLIISRYDALALNKSIYDKQLEKPIKERIIDMDSLRSVIQRQEMELARDSKAYGDFAQNLRINWKDVQKKLGSDDIAIEFLDFPLYGTDSTMYVALTLKQGYNNPHLTTLFEKRQLMSIPEDDYYTHTDLYNLLWKPLDAELAGVKNIYFSPSGELHRIGIEYIPVTTTENICDKYSLYRLSSTRQLAYIQDDTKGEKSVVYGGLKYDAEVPDADTPPTSGENRGFLYIPYTNVDSLALRGSYKYLPGTKDEADYIVSDLDYHSIPYIYYFGALGTEESFKRLNGTRPRTLHIATHGFYLTEQDAERKSFINPLLRDDSYAYKEDKPMTRSGLLLSGCSRALNHESVPEGVEDGILTADEISKLDMRGLDLVVLSACQTGLGDITSGEGVFGLQRGFKNAGAKTIIMSLWKVSDIATQHLMMSFYNHYLSGMPKEQAFRMAQTELRNLIGPGQKKPDWAAFVMLDGI